MTVLVVAIALVGVAGPALAGWASTGTGTGQVSAHSLNPATGLGTTAGSPSHTAIDVNFTPGSNPAGATYTVTRDKKKDGTAGPEVACSGITASPCADTGLKASTAYSYTIKAVLANWSAPTPGSTTPRSTDAAPVVLTITGVVHNTGNKKVSFSGTGAAATVPIVVSICKANSFPCSVANSAGTSTAATPSAGSWTSSASTENLTAATSTYYARASQGAANSAVFTFTFASL